MKLVLTGLILLTFQLTIYTHYYLGQAYEKLGKKEKASESLHKTLKKQIEIKDYEPLDW